jgi:Domain of unknown function (DUF5666)
MKIRFACTLFIGLALAAAACAQEATPATPDGQNSGLGQDGGMGGGMGRGMRGGQMGMMMGRGVSGTVTAVAADHYTIKSFQGESYTIHFSANTRIMKQPAGMRGGQGSGVGSSGGGRDGGWQGRRGEGGGGNPPQQIKATDIKVGDAIGTMGDVDASAKSVGAMAIMLLDPERVKQMQEMEANYGKTWLMGKVTAIDGVKVTLTGGVDNAAHTFVADENTTFRKRRDPITLADIQVGDMVRVDGAVKDGAFSATAVNDMGVPGEARVPRNDAPQQQ